MGLQSANGSYFMNRCDAVTQRLPACTDHQHLLGEELPNLHKCSEKKDKDVLPTWVITVVSRWVSS